MSKLTSLIILLFFPVSLFSRNCGVPFASVLVTLNVALIGYTIISKDFYFKNILRRLILLFFLLICLALLHYWTPFNDINRIGKAEYILLFTGLIIFVVTIYKYTDVNTMNSILLFMLSFILFSSVVTSPRSFHNMYRYRTYEEYIRHRFSEYQGGIADIYIDRYKRPDRPKADVFLSKAKQAESLKEFKQALRYYNLSIELYPDDASRYYDRGLLKLTRLEINEDIAISAVKDFRRSIQLDPAKAEVYFHKAVALGYLGFHGRAILEKRKVWELDSMLSEDAFKKKYGISKEAFSVPLHP